ncbi:hypothetical protein GW17_00003031, partial [Ensete ventricosum]
GSLNCGWFTSHVNPFAPDPLFRFKPNLRLPTQILPLLLLAPTTAAAAFFSVALRIPSLLLHGLHSSSASHLRTRFLFPSFRAVFLVFVVALADLAFVRIFSPSEPSLAIAIDATVAVLAAADLFLFLSKLSLERSASKLTEKVLRFIAGFLAFPSALLISFFFVPVSRAARAFWPGTDQLRWNLPVVSCGPFTKVLLYVAVLAGAAAPPLWVIPVAVVPAGWRRHHVGWVQEAKSLDSATFCRPAAYGTPP